MNIQNTYLMERDKLKNHRSCSMLSVVYNMCKYLARQCARCKMSFHQFERDKCFVKQHNRSENLSATSQRKIECWCLMWWRYAIFSLFGVVRLVFFGVVSGCMVYNWWKNVNETLPSDQTFAIHNIHKPGDFSKIQWKKQNTEKKNVERKTQLSIFCSLGFKGKYVLHI